MLDKRLRSHRTHNLEAFGADDDAEVGQPNAKKIKLAFSELVAQTMRKATRGDRLKLVTEAVLNAAASSDDNEAAPVLEGAAQQLKPRDAAAYGDLRQLVLPRLSE